MESAEGFELQRDLGRLEGTVAAQGDRISDVDKRIASLDEKLQEHNIETAAKLDRLIAFQEQQKGGARMLIAIGTIASSLIGGITAWVIEAFRQAH